MKIEIANRPEEVCFGYAQTFVHAIPYVGVVNTPRGKGKGIGLRGSATIAKAIQFLQEAHRTALRAEKIKAEHEERMKETNPQRRGGGVDGPQ